MTYARTVRWLSGERKYQIEAIENSMGHRGIHKERREAAPFRVEERTS